MSSLSVEFLLSRRQAVGHLPAPKPVLNRMRRLGIRRFATKCEQTNQALAFAQNFYPFTALSFYSTICFYSSYHRHNNNNNIITKKPPHLHFLSHYHRRSTTSSRQYNCGPKPERSFLGPPITCQP